MRVISAAGLCITLFVGAGCLTPPTGPTVRGSGPKVLFIGNSYLYHQDIPGIVQSLAAASGKAIAVATMASPDVALIDHWNGGGAAREIDRGGWAWVVLQQGPSSVEANRDTLRMAVALFDARIREAGAATALFSAWPSSERRQDFPRAIESYTLAAGDVGGTLLPVAASWLDAWNRDPSLSLYADGLHPSAAGAYVAALVIAACLFDVPPAGAPATLEIIGSGAFSVAPAAAVTLQAAATATATAVCG